MKWTKILYSIVTRNKINNFVKWVELKIVLSTKLYSWEAVNFLDNGFPSGFAINVREMTKS